MYKHILVPLDGSELAECVLAHVVAVAKGSTSPKVTLIRVITPLHLHGGVESRFSPEERQHLEEDSKKVAKDYLNKTKRRLKRYGISVQSEVLYGPNIVDELVDYVDKNAVDLVVVASHGRSGVSRWVWGSVTDKLLRSASVPAMVIRSPGCSVTGI